MWTLVLLTLWLEEISAGFNAKAWQSVGYDFTFPEQQLEEVQSKENVGITFSGGGDRAYIAAIGYLAAFHELGFTERVKYIAGSSGGSWATAVFSYYQKDNVSDSVMLGDIVHPADIEYNDLTKMDENCVRSLTNSSVIEVTGITFSAWQDSIQNVYFSPSGIRRGTPFSYDNDTVADIKARNSDLLDVDFHLLRGLFGESSSSNVDSRPYPIIQGAMCGPEDLMPWLPANRNYSLMEWTPLTAGVAFTNDVVYVDVNFTVTQTKTVGGFVEPYASNGNFRPNSGLPGGTTEGYLTVPGPSTPTCDLALACGTSSWVPGTASAASTNAIVQLTVGELRYWAPSASNPAQQYDMYLTGDGAGISNTNIISLLQRNVSTIMAFVSSSTPVQNSTNWNPTTQPLTEDSMDFTVPAWFGQIPEDLQVVWDVGYDLQSSHIFDENEWLPFITTMQSKQSSGDGIVFSMTHTTVTNSKFGIEAGRKVKVIWTYLGRAEQWENQLNEQMRNLVVPSTDPYNQANVISNGPFQSFPHYGTAVANINIERANLLADFTGWMVYNNQNIFREALGLPLIADDDDIADDDVFEPSGTNDDDFVSGPEGIITFSLLSVAVVAMGIYISFCYGRKKELKAPINLDGRYQENSVEISTSLTNKRAVLSDQA